MIWSKEQVDSFFSTNIILLTKNNILLPYDKIKILWKNYKSWFNTINRWKCWYINIEDFIEKNKLLKTYFPEAKRINWNKVTIDNFFIKHRDIITIDGDLKNHKEIRKLWYMFNNWYQAIVRSSNKSYKNMDDFRKFHVLKKEIKIKYSKSRIDNIFEKYKNDIVVNNNLITAKAIREHSKELYWWYQAIIRGKSWYINMNCFKDKNKLNSFK